MAAGGCECGTSGGFFLFILQFSLPLQYRDGAFMICNIYFVDVLYISIRSEVTGLEIFSGAYITY